MSARPPAARTARAMANARSGGGGVIHRPRAPRQLPGDLVGFGRRDGAEDREPPRFAKRIHLGLRRGDTVGDEPGDLFDGLAWPVTFDLQAVVARDARA